MNKKNIDKLITRYIDLLKSNDPLFNGLPEECSKQEMSSILNDMKDNFKNYSNEEICRQLGFTNGVMNFDSSLVSISINNASGIKKIIKETLKSLDSYTDPDINEEHEEHDNEVEEDKYNDCLYMDVNSSMIAMLLTYAQNAFKAGVAKELEIQYVIGYVQGIFSLFSLIKIEEEKEFIKNL